MRQRVLDGERRTGMTSRFSALVEELTDPCLPSRLSPHLKGAKGTRAAVLVLLSQADDPDLVFTERAGGLRHHAGQLSFPGGSTDPQDADAVATALREAHEEINLNPGAVTVLGRLPMRRLPVSSLDVTPVVGVWNGDEPILIASPDEVSSIQRWKISELSDPRNRVTALHPNGYTGPAWVFGDLFLWGFTAYLTDQVLNLAGWEQPWDTDNLVDVPERFLHDDRRKSVSADSPAISRH